MSDYTVERSVLSAGTPDEWAHLVRALDGEITARDAQLTELRAGFAALEDRLTDSREEVDGLRAVVELAREFRNQPHAYASSEGIYALVAAENALDDALSSAKPREDVRPGLRRRIKDLEAAIRDIDAHATPLGGEEFVEVGYAISIGCLHRALALLGQIPTVHHTAHIPDSPPEPKA